MNTKVIKRNGTKEKFDAGKISVAIFKAAKEVYPHAQAQTIAEAALPLVLDEIRKHSAGPIAIEDIQDIVEEMLMITGFAQVAKAYIIYRKYREEIRFAKEKLGIRDELKLSLNAISLLKERYLLKNDARATCETPKEMFARVAKTVAKAERNFSAKEESFYCEKFYETMTSLEFLPNSPTLMNAGTSLGQLSACFVLPVEDSIAKIFDTLKAMALIHQSGGGTGFSFSRLRPKDDLVSSTKGTASGPVSFIEVFDAATKVIKQGGKRRGANMGILRCDHPDIFEFIETKSSREMLQNFNISVGITDAFMEAVKKDREFSLINPRTKKETKRIKARTLFSLITLSAWRCADPGLIFLDRINRTHPLKNLGTIEATNPCGEIPLLPYESCNLGSINLSKFVKKEKVDWQALAETVALGVRFLDNTIEVNKFPLKEIEAISRNNRKIGLGVMGFADMLIRLRIPYNSKEAIEFARCCMRFIRRASVNASMQLAKERGVFTHWKHSAYAKTNLRLRNATLNSIAPTGSISIIASASSGIEPLFALSFLRNCLEGTKLLETNPLFEEIAREEGIYSKRLVNRIRTCATLKDIGRIPKILKSLFVTTFDISTLDHLRIQAAFQEFTDNAVSKTVNLPYEATIDDIRTIYRKAYEMKLKGITVYRYASKKEQVLYALPQKEDPATHIRATSDFDGGCFNVNCSL
ncbi:MAG: adenosylcobalamin-dependent ribonucleoside-diphosphate reductase [Candidatus Omnitrophica bacterium]|nr:adenosylcobalamin-dependent ribonucleoside-diphosphate reductase [Candidatus Omnitrophota bacterium]